MKVSITAVAMLLALCCGAQKNVVPVSSSALTGIPLPAASKQDKRTLYVSATKMLLEMVGKKENTGIGSIELLYLPVTYTLDSLKTALQLTNWKVLPVQGEPDYFWLSRSNKKILAQFSVKKNKAEVYFGEATANSPETVAAAETHTTPSVQKDVVPNSGTSYTFTTTTWDDGWISTIKNDFVEVTKANIKVLLHFPNKTADAYNSVLKDGDYNAWNTLVAPRYSNLKNLEWKSIQSWESISFMEGDATENASGKNVHIVLFKKHYSNGTGRYLELVSDNKTTYEKEFGPYHNTEFDWDKTANMQYRNKFSIGANDIVGKWSSTDYSAISYYYVNTGGHAGTAATSTADAFTFFKDGTYESDHSGASGMVGNMRFSRQVFKGKSSVSNWNIELTNRFQGATEKYDIFFEAVKGGRAFILKDRLNSVYTLVKQQ